MKKLEELSALVSRQTFELEELRQKLPPPQKNYPKGAGK